MLKPIFLCCVLQGTVLSAQNWALINPDYKYNYSNDGTDTISNQVFVTHVDTLGVDSFRYELNRIVQLCSPCQNVPVECGNEVIGKFEQPQVFAGTAIASNSRWTLYGEDTLTVEPLLPVGATWTGPNGVQGSISSASFPTLLGQPDSVKWFTFSNGISMGVSKSFGVIWFTRNTELYSLIGLQGGVDLGVRYPIVGDYFNYHPEDELQYHKSSSGTDGLCVSNSTENTKYQILSRTDQPTRTDYMVRVLQHVQYNSYPLTGGGGLCTSGSWSHVDTIPLGVDHYNWSSENFFGTNWMLSIWPNAYGPPDHTGNSGWDSGYQGVRWQATIDGSGRYVLEPFVVGSGGFEGSHLIYTCWEDTSFVWADYEDSQLRFVEGVGRTYGRGIFFEHSQEEILVGYVIGDQTYGTIDPDDIVLGISTERISKPPALYPNPTSDHIILSSATPGTTCTILDLNGRILATHKITAINERINVQHLQPGAYLLKVEGMSAQRFMIMR